MFTFRRKTKGDPCISLQHRRGRAALGEHPPGPPRNSPQSCERSHSVCASWCTSCVRKQEGSSAQRASALRCFVYERPHGAPLHLAVIPGYTLYKPAHAYMCSFSRWKEKMHSFSDRCVYACRLPPAAAGICIRVCAHTCICLTAVCVLRVYRVWTHAHMPGFPHCV